MFKSGCSSERVCSQVGVQVLCLKIKCVTKGMNSSVPTGPKLVPFSVNVEPPAVSRLAAPSTEVRVGLSYFRLKALLAPPTLIECSPIVREKVIAPEGAPEDVEHVMAVLGVVTEQVEAKSFPLGPYVAVMTG